MISCPLQMEGAIIGSLVDNLGENTPTNWRLYVRDAQDNAYVELPNETTTAFEQGRGYWLITKHASRIDTGPNEGLSAPTGEAFTINLEEGWNQIGNPFLFTVAWDSVQVFVDGDTLPVSDVEPSLVEPP